MTPTALPREIASRRAFENAMSLDIAMGGSTNTILHLLAAAQEAGVDFDMAAIDSLSRKILSFARLRQVPRSTIWKTYTVRVA